MRAIFLLSLAFVLLLGCVSPTDHRIPDEPNPPVSQPPVSPPKTPVPTTPSTNNSQPYTVEELKSGEINHILHCGGPLWVNGSEYASFVNTFPNHTPIMIVHFASFVPLERFTSGLEMLKEDVAKHPNSIPFLSFQYSYDVEGELVVYDQEVVEGKLDNEIRTLAQYVKSLGKPVFFRPGYEFNGWWNGYSKEYYADSFKHIHTLFQEEGASNAIFVWTYEPTGGNEPYIDFYPGDSYVDWWGIDLFGHTFNDPKTNGLATQFIADAQKRGKPVIFPESAPSGFDLDKQSTWSGWFVPYFGLMEKYPSIKGFCYTNHDFSDTEDGWGDMRIDQSSLKDEWEKELDNPKYLHSD